MDEEDLQVEADRYLRQDCSLTLRGTSRWVGGHGQDTASVCQTLSSIPLFLSHCTL